MIDFARGISHGGVKGPAFVPADPAGQKQLARRLELYRKARQALKKGEQLAVQSGELGVDLSLEFGELRNQSQVGFTGQRHVGGHLLQFVGGVWIDDGFKVKTPVLVVKAQSEAYFRILERRPEVKDVFRLGNYLVWLTPSGTALVIDATDGKTKLDDKDIDKLFKK